MKKKKTTDFFGLEVDISVFGFFFFNRSTQQCYSLLYFENFSEITINLQSSLKQDLEIQRKRR